MHNIISRFLDFFLFGQNRQKEYIMKVEQS